MITRLAGREPDSK